jgi:hypothetical protein
VCDQLLAQSRPIGRYPMRFVLVILTLLFTTASGTTQTPADDPWGPLRHLEGRWEGAIEGRLGTGKGVRSYEFVLDGLFLLYRHASVRLPQEKSPEGDHHRELGVFSYDSQGKSIMLREFMSEGVVLLSRCEVTKNRIVCVSEHVESGARYPSAAYSGIREPTCVYRNLRTGLSKG